MPSASEQLRQLERVERYRASRNWCLVAALVAFILALAAAGVVSIGNPVTLGSFYAVLAQQGLFHASVAALLALCLGLLIVAAIFQGLLHRRYGEV